MSSNVCLLNDAFLRSMADIQERRNRVTRTLREVQEELKNPTPIPGYSGTPHPCPKWDELVHYRLRMQRFNLSQIYAMQTRDLEARGLPIGDYAFSPFSDIQMPLEALNQQLLWHRAMGWRWRLQFHKMRHERFVRRQHLEQQGIIPLPED